MTSLTTNPHPQQKFFFRVQTIRLAASFDTLARSVTRTGLEIFPREAMCSLPVFFRIAWINPDVKVLSRNFALWPQAKNVSLLQHYNKRNSVKPNASTKLTWRRPQNGACWVGFGPRTASLTPLVYAIAVHLKKLCAVCIYLAIKSTACPITSVTVILFKDLFELCEIDESRPTCNCNLVKFFYKLQLHSNQNLNYNYNYMKICK